MRSSRVSSVIGACGLCIRGPKGGPLVRARHISRGLASALFWYTHARKLRSAHETVCLDSEQAVDMHRPPPACWPLGLRPRHDQPPHAPSRSFSSHAGTCSQATRALEPTCEAHEGTTRWHGRSGSPATGYPQPEAPNVGTVRLGEALGSPGTDLAHSSRGDGENGRNRARGRGRGRWWLGCCHRWARPTRQCPREASHERK
jgi:hypothetical protein